ncbi:MBL fold metallo-hydrolase [Rhodococcus fascians]|nr:MBL fold metallo-hydrolase [Rhodococcus fascians]MBY3823737.1 MBL fold metallo-hydrolase [Rhodococcus fascians]MBY3834259.1 MBL fold metallo-hydrolase [Rhodococcus fascians]MBY3863472.1 MBL fold metallo-hydrolase [Rhodococcus fascians]MBY3882942.1 MBL fold metallo-hydrolase [Rhodococcus fascians]
MYQIDFLPVESESGTGSKSGDAIASQITLDDGRDVVLVIDGGYGATGESMVEHIRDHYGTDHVDIVVSTHPDADHINGLKYVIETLSVGELLIHRPQDHASDVSDFSNLEAVNDLIEAAETRGVTVTEPFTGLERWAGQLQILGPTEEYYCELLAQHLQEEKSGVAASRRTLVASLMTKGRDLLAKALPYLPIETLGEDGETAPRNNTSAVVLLIVDGHRILFTGDAGISALSAAADRYEVAVGPFPSHPLRTLQAPHHGSRRNLAPSLLNRIVGAPGAPHSESFHAPISSAKASPKHPSPKVVNALTRRGGYVVATEGKTICLLNEVARPGWNTVAPIPPLVEDDD